MKLWFVSNVSYTTPGFNGILLVEVAFINNIKQGDKALTSANQLINAVGVFHKDLINCNTNLRVMLIFRFSNMFFFILGVGY